MQVRRLCQVCQREPGDFNCEKCGRLMGKSCKKGVLCEDCTLGPMTKR